VGQQRGVNDLHFLVTARIFIEYTRRGIWFLAWATPQQVAAVEKLTFERPGSPGIAKMDELLNEALGRPKKSPLLNPVKEFNNEPFLNCLHALTHGNPASVRMFAFGLDKIFRTDMLLLRAEVELNIFKILVYRRLLGQELKDVWAMLGTIYNQPDNLRKNVQIAAYQLKQKGSTPEKLFGLELP